MRNNFKSDIKKEANPIENTNILSKWIFWWLRKLFIKGYSNDLKEDDMYEHPKSLDSHNITMKFLALWNDELKRKNPSVLRLCLRAYGSVFIPLELIFVAAISTLTVLQPICLGGLVSYFTQNENDNTVITKSKAYLYASGIVLCTLIPSMLYHPFTFLIFQIGVKLRLGLAGLIYQKTLKLSRNVANDGFGARAINILSNDLTKLEEALFFLHHLLKGPILVAILTYLSYREIGVSALLGIGIFLIFIPIQGFAGKKVGNYRAKTAKCTDYRVKIMNEIIQDMYDPKMRGFSREKVPLY